MSQENVEILRRAIQAFDRGDDEEWIAAWHPAAELHDFTELPDVPQPYRGHDGIRRWAANVRSVLGEAVLMEVQVRGVGEQSGVPVAMMVHVLAWFRGDKIVRTRAFLDRPTALEAAGLRRRG